jgi:hypothetical protein
MFCPPPGFCQAAGDVDCWVRSIHAHCPNDAKSWFAWTDSQYRPWKRPIEGSSVITKLGPPVKLWFGRDWSSVPGRSPEFAYTATLTEVAGPGPLKYTPCTSTPVTFHPGPAGTSKSSAASSSKVSSAASKFWELEPTVPALSYWS